MKCTNCENDDCVCHDCELGNVCMYHGSSTCGGSPTDYCIKEDEERGTFLGYDVDDPDDLEDCWEDFYEG